MSISVILFFTLFGFLNAEILPNGKVVGGVAVEISEAPYTAALLIDSSGDGVFAQACGAVIVGSRALLTSAQCSSPFSSSRLRVRVGSTFHNAGGQVYDVSSIVVFPNYNSVTFANDLSILNLNTTINFGPTVSTITLPAQDLELADGDSCNFYGWGRLSINGTTPSNLHRVTLPTVNHNLCVSAYSGIFNVTNQMICSGRHGIGGVGTCSGDIGGPLVNGGLLRGISSYGRGCAEPQFPGIFTKISSFRTWLNSQL